MQRMHTSNSCKNLCFVLRKCLASEPEIEKVEEQTISVRCVEEDEQLSITTNFHGTAKHYLRKKDDPVRNTLKRMHLNLTHPHNKKKSKKKDNNVLGHEPNHGLEHYYPDDVIIAIRDNSNDEKVALNGDASNLEAWKDVNVLTIGDEEFKICVNAPAVLSATLPKSLMAGYPVVPNLELEFAERACSKYMWFRKAYNTDDKSKKDSKCKKKPGACCELNSTWEFLSNKFKYIPSNNDIGCKLKFICIPKRHDIFGFAHEMKSENTVEAGPGLCPFDERHLYTAKAVDDKDMFRVVSYNILADVYANTEFARERLYPYCSSYAIDFSYRGQLILKEVLGYNSDIICLQECDMKIFHSFLQPAMAEEGFDGHFQRKAGEMPEGEAIFYRRSKYSLVSEASVIISKAIELNCNKEILTALESSPELLESMKKRTAIGQIIAIKDNQSTNRIICILNTHLYFRPAAHNVRLLQMSILINYFKVFIDGLKEAETGCRVAAMICGDFNSMPKSAVIECLTSGKILDNHPVWKTENSAETINLNIQHNFSFFSACGFPKYTNYVAGFKDTVDYIMLENEHFKVESCVPFPDEKVLQLNTALPSITVPSDHLALVCDLAWKE